MQASQCDVFDYPKLVIVVEAPYVSAKGKPPNTKFVLTGQVIYPILALLSIIF